MIAADTNILVRVFHHDDPAQVEAVRGLLTGASARDPVLVTNIVLAEFCWVMGRLYKHPKGFIVDCLNALMVSFEIAFEDAQAVQMALKVYSEEPRADFADCLVAAVAQREGARTTYTFDKIAARNADMTYLAH